MSFPYFWKQFLSRVLLCIMLSIMLQFSIGCLVFTWWRFSSVWVQLGSLSESLWWLQSSAVCIQAGQSWCHSVADNQLSVSPSGGQFRPLTSPMGAPVEVMRSSEVSPRPRQYHFCHIPLLNHVRSSGDGKWIFDHFIPSELGSRITF